MDSHAQSEGESAPREIESGPKERMDTLGTRIRARLQALSKNEVERPMNRPTERPSSNDQRPTGQRVNQTLTRARATSRAMEERNPLTKRQVAISERAQRQKRTQDCHLLDDPWADELNETSEMTGSTSSEMVNMTSN